MMGREDAIGQGEDTKRTLKMKREQRQQKVAVIFMVIL